MLAYSLVVAKVGACRGEKRSWAGGTAYAESKLYDVFLAFAIARRWPEVFSNALGPGWVATRMGGRGAPDDIDQAHLTQAWLALATNRRRWLRDSVSIICGFVSRTLRYTMPRCRRH